MSDEGYDQAYSNTPDLFGAEPEPILVRFGHLIDRSKPVLDVGCGQGRHALWMARQGLEVIALDPSEEALEIVTNAADGLPVTTVQGSYADVGSSSFSATCVFGLLQILTLIEREQLLHAIESWSAPGSMLFLTAWTTDDPRHEQIAASWQQIGDDAYQATDGRVRSYLTPAAAVDLLPGWHLIHHWEGIGPWHRHGDSPKERHGVVELVVKR